ncbi:hypothetical protein FB45DRAFT_869226 [Roridomyces roridus]|uniref:Uncharacterized protein n=1 Tax=Roridomyces roridus TaxID=1738132 RepID=A0AAD7FIS1_9AGAR|nr:hypothetical protein FB45DRAFT_869226 [Roridomyces roridus]
MAFSFPYPAFLDLDLGDPHDDSTEKRPRKSQQPAVGGKNGARGYIRDALPHEFDFTDGRIIAPLLIPYDDSYITQALASLSSALCTPDASTSSAADAATAFRGRSTQGRKQNTIVKAASFPATHEHPDVQQFFQLLIERLREERARVVAEGAYGRGVGLELVLEDGEGEPDWGRGEDGGRANGYALRVRAVWVHGILRSGLAALLRPCTALEILPDCPCLSALPVPVASDSQTRSSHSKRCSSRRTWTTDNRDVEEENRDGGRGAVAVAEEGQVEEQVQGRCQVARCGGEGRAVERLHVRALEAGRLTEEEEELGRWNLRETSVGGDALKGVELERFSGGPPPILALHVNRSIHMGMRMIKNG